MLTQTDVRKGNIVFFLAAFCLCILLLPAQGSAGGPERVKVEASSPQTLKLFVGRSLILESVEPVRRVSLVSPETADAMVLTPHQVYVTGRRPGVTNLTFWGGDNKVIAVFDLEVSYDVSRLKEKIHEILPEERDIRVTATNDSVTLSGTVSSASNLSQVLSVAEAFVQKSDSKTSKLINLLEVAGIHQVMLEVRVSEMSRSLMKRLGVNITYLSSSGRTFGLTLLNSLSSLPSSGAFPKDPLTVSSNVDAIFRFLTNNATWTTFIDALKEEGLVKILAEPTLITLSGRTASFLAGGEFPIPVPQSSTGGGTTITVEYKPFGVALNFTPTVLSSGKINMQVAPEVSELDFSNSVTIQGFVIPSLNTRRVSTVIELADGQSFAVAGLLREDVREIVDKFPVLGDIPILGSLFRSTNFQKNETELVVTVTPHLVKPLDMTKQTLPTDQLVEPNDFEFYLLGSLEGRRAGNSPGSAGPSSMRKDGGMEGEFGHIVPQ